MIEMFKNLLKLNRKKQSIPSVEDRICDMFENLTVDELSIKIGEDLVPFAEELCVRISELRERLYENYGYIIPAVRILDSAELQENSYCIFLRENPAFVGYTVATVDYACEEIVNELEDICFKHIDIVFSTELTERYIEQAAKKVSGLVYFVTHFIPVTGIKDILINLIRERKSIKDINYVFSQICEQCANDTDTCKLRDPKKVFEKVKSKIF